MSIRVKNDPGGLHVPHSQLCRIASASVLLFSLIFLNQKMARAEDVTVAVAANFSAAMKEIAARFESDTRDHLIISYGATGQFRAQIMNGAPYAVFLTADDVTGKQLADDGLAVPDSRFVYATGALVLWSPDPLIAGSLETLLEQGSFKHIAMANPALAPYGAAARETLENLGLWNHLQDKILYGENISQAYSMVVGGGAHLGFVAKSQVMRHGHWLPGSVWVVPPSLYKPLNQEAILLLKGQNSKAAHALMAYLKSEKSRSIVKAYGYVP